jgi:Rieske Fe-S protein
MADDLSRRQLVQRVAVLGAALAGCVRRIDPSRTVAVDAPVDGLVQARLADLPELQREGGSVVLRPAGSVAGVYGRYPYPVLLVAGRVGRYLAFNADCPHAGCDLTWVGSDEEVECPCHGSRFASDGRVLNPPANQNLTALQPEVDASGVVRVQLLPGDGTYPALQNGAVTIDIADYPVLQQDGGVVEGKAAGYPYPIVIVRLAGLYRALSGVCPHQGCTVIPKSDGFRCPCHGSQFTLSGSLVNGPAQTGLDTLQLTQPSSGTLRIAPPPV